MQDEYNQIMKDQRRLADQEYSKIKAAKKAAKKKAEEKSAELLAEYAKILEDQKLSLEEMKAKAEE